METTEKPGEYPMLAYSLIRFSDNEQRKGDTIRRQVAMRDDWLARKGIALDASLTLPPSCVSAFRGKQKTKSLGLFLQACHDGRVKKGSYLIIENLDRLSREDIPPALKLFLEILEFGIIIVTIDPEMEYRTEKLDLTSLILAIVELSRGHSESRTKSNRLSQKWAERRLNMAKKPMTKICPAWLKLVRGKFVPRPKAVAIVRRVYQLASAGNGNQNICRILNDEGVKPITGSRFWHQSYIQRLLSRRDVLGEFQPNILKDGKWVAVGKPVKGYYPRIIPDSAWKTARAATLSRTEVGPGGRRPKTGRISGNVSNLFTHLVYQNDEPMGYRTSKTDGYLQVSRVDSDRSPGCRYRDFEKAMLTWVREIKLNLSNENFDVLTMRKADLERREKILRDKIDSDPDLEVLLDKYGDLQRELKEVARGMEQAAVPAQQNFLHTQRLISLLATTENRESVRRELKQHISMLVKRIDVRVEGGLKCDKRVFLTVTFADGTVRKIWFEIKRHASDPLGDQIRLLKSQGVKVGQIAEQLGCARPTVYRKLAKEKANSGMWLPPDADGKETWLSMVTFCRESMAQSGVDTTEMDTLLARQKAL